MPGVAGKDRGKIFGELYDQIFTGDTTASAILAPTRVFQAIESRKSRLQRAIRTASEYRQSHLYLIDGAYHVLYAVGLLMSKQGDDKEDVAQARRLVGRAGQVVSRP
jgi:hypothetical protein